ncbi:thioesterase family protein [Zavarzinia compransoris]|uniref:Thioesterase family protein n=1 Tax=Zavarzinia compransoris TaxID=1264899 RepID=A0A317E535_9PROT|nr:thioesterase family protein [Zavarzinia compransoris]PWR22099.1 thioesterase family protein [Zavarzinia compransoris]TDP47157.1 acyl-CoA thioesterase [Zavarzinia compransoris]
MTTFTELLASITEREERFTTSVTEDWAQGRTLYGGASGALCLAAALRRFPDLPPLRAAQFAFVGPAAGVLEISPAILRQGKSATFVGVDLAGEAGPAARALFCFGAGRDSAVTFNRLPAPAVPAPEDCEDFFRGGPRPNFAHQFEVVGAGGSVPFSMADVPEYVLWLRHKDRAAPADLVSLVALADMPPPAAMVRFPTFGPISTITWAMEILNPPPADQDAWFLMTSRAEDAGAGYSSQAMNIWAADGTPLVAARQSVALFV